jgi:ABC-type bacteriocin/lantibiotic exporter with double-glycine peptidase domain
MKHMSRNNQSARSAMITFGITCLLVVLFLSILYWISPTFFVTYIVPITIFIAVTLTGIMALIIGSNMKKGKRSS